MSDLYLQREILAGNILLLPFLFASLVLVYNRVARDDNDDDKSFRGQIEHHYNLFRSL